MKKEMLSLGKAADICAVNRVTLWSYVKSGELKASRTPGGHYRVTQNDLNEFILQKGMKAESKRHPSTLKVLVVDDDESVRKTLKKRLVRENFKVETASDGFKAGLKAQAIAPDLIILDLMMEGLDGFEVCKTIRENTELRKIKILIMTGFDTPENQEKAMSAGADSYLPKGGPFEDILKTIKNLLA